MQSVASGNKPLAESDLGKAATRYSGTNGGAESALALAKLYYLGWPLAAGDLRAVVRRGRQDGPAVRCARSTGRGLRGNEPASHGRERIRERGVGRAVRRRSGERTGDGRASVRDRRQPGRGREAVDGSGEGPKERVSHPRPRSGSAAFRPRSLRAELGAVLARLSRTGRRRAAFFSLRRGVRRTVIARRAACDCTSVGCVR